LNLILFGFKACGKSYLGKKLAERICRPFLETDHIIEKNYEQSHHQKLTCREIALKHGDPFFRKLEDEAVESLKEVKDSVIALGGGTVINPVNVHTLAKVGTLVFLQIDKETVWERIMKGPFPSYLDEKDPRGSFERMYHERKEVYEQIPAVWIDVNQEVETVLKELLLLI
jgi:shikimate kinase